MHHVSLSAFVSLVLIIILYRKYAPGSISDACGLTSYIFPPFDRPFAVSLPHVCFPKRSSDALPEESIASGQGRGTESLKLSRQMSQGAGVVNKVKEMDKQYRYNGWHLLRWASFVLLGGGASGAYLYRDEVTEWLGYSGAKITATLGDENVRFKREKSHVE